MQSTAKWEQGVRSVVDNGRNHSVTVDLPEEKNGTDQGPTALELSFMGLSGCISTIFAMIAAKSNVTLESLTVNVEDTSPENVKVMSSAKATVRVKSEDSEEKLQKVLDKTKAACPVGILFESAGVTIETTLVKEG